MLLLNFSTLLFFKAPLCCSNESYSFVEMKNPRGEFCTIIQATFKSTILKLAEMLIGRKEEADDSSYFRAQISTLRYTDGRD